MLNINGTEINYQQWWENLVEAIGHDETFDAPATGIREPLQHATQSYPARNYLWCLELEELVSNYGLKINWRITRKLMTFDAVLYFDDPSNEELTKNEEVQKFHEQHETYTNLITLREFTFGNRRKRVSYFLKKMKVDRLRGRSTFESIGLKCNQDINSAIRLQENSHGLGNYFSNSYAGGYLNDNRYGFVAWLNIILDALDPSSDLQEDEIRFLIEKLGVELLFVFDKKTISYGLLLKEIDKINDHPFVYFFEDKSIPPITSINNNGEIKRLESADDVSSELIERIKQDIETKNIEAAEEINDAFKNLDF